MALNRAVTAVVAALTAITGLLAAGCTGSTGRATAVVSAPIAAPAPNVGAFLPPNYHVLRQSHVHLEAPPHPADLVVVSAGPGVNGDQPVQGGTEDVQVLSYDTVAQRWNLAFDAANKVINPDYLPAVSDTTAGPQPLLPQSDTMTNILAEPVQFLPGTPQLLIYGLDESFNHPSGVLGVLDISNGTPTIAYYDSEVDMSVPTVSGRPGAGRITINAAFNTAIDPACCPVRQFQQVIAATGDQHTAPPAIGVVEDDRPWLGVWYVTPDGSSNGSAIVVGVAAGSPASAVLTSQDQLLGVDDTSLPAGDVYQPAIVDEVALHRPGDHIVLKIKRNGQVISAPLIVSSHNSSSYQSDAMAPQASVLGINTVDSPAGMTPGVLIQGVLPGSAASVAHLGVGDDIIGVGRVPVRSTTDLQIALMGQAGHSIGLTIQHADGTSATVSVIPQAVPPNTSGVLAASGL